MSRLQNTNRNLELLEPYEWKRSRTVLRGEDGSNAVDLPDRPSDLEQREGRASARATRWPNYMRTINWMLLFMR